MARWHESYNVGDKVEYDVPCVGWCIGRVIRKTSSEMPIVKCGGRTIWAATRKTEIRHFEPRMEQRDA